MKTKETYLTYVKGVLNSIPENTPVFAAYDTGYGLHIVNEDLGHSPMTLFVVGSSVAKVQVPNIENNKKWDEAWLAGKKLVNEFVDKRKG